MSKEYVFERTLSMLDNAGKRATHVTINPMLPSPSASPTKSVDLGLTIPSLESLPPLNIAQQSDDTAEFEILGLLGIGGMGVVELARQNAMQRDVVIKRPHSADTSNHQINALVKEGVLTGRLEHPNIIPVHFLGRTPQGWPALVMKRVAGFSWRELIHNDDHPTWKQTQEDRLDRHLRILLQVSNAVEFAHSKGVLHRDIKPENVMIGEYGEVYLLDWGIGLLLDEHGEVTPKQFAGTPAYMAPEMLGDRLTAQTDIYLLGSTLHEVLTQTFRHNGEDFSEVVFQAKRSKPYSYGPHIPEELASICNRATHSDPAQRFPHVAAFREAIEEHLRHRSALRLIESAQERLAQLKQQAHEKTTTLETPQRIAFHALASECRFALREALRIWPESNQAQTALRDCTLLMAHIELQLGNLPSAELLLAEVVDPPSDLLLRLEQLRTKQAQSSADQARLRSIEHHLDARVSARGRSVMMAALAFTTVFTVSLTFGLQGSFIVNTHKAAFLTSGFIIFVSTVVALFYRHVLIRTVFNQRLTTIFFLTCAAIQAHRGLGFFVQTSVESVFAVDIIILGLGFATAGAVVEKRLFLSALPCPILLPAAAIWPEHSYTWMVLALISSTFIASRIWTEQERILAQHTDLSEPSAHIPAQDHSPEHH